MSRARTLTVLAVLALIFSGLVGLGAWDGLYERTVDTPAALRAALDLFYQPFAHKRRIADLTAVRDALEQYRQAKGSYPVSAIFDGVASRYGESRPDWIAGLAPAFIARLPEDPRHDGSTAHQYLYMSDGADFKLLANQPGDTDIVARIRPEMVDPNQPCAAYGFWTEGAKTWFPSDYDPKRTARRMADLVALAGALDAYRLKYGGYPVSQGFDGLYSSWGRSASDWIPGLVPEFLPELPRDPRGNADPANQYLYKSDGRDYKLIAHHPEDCPVVRRDLPRLVDPLRGCLAYGVWSSGAGDW